MDRKDNRTDTGAISSPAEADNKDPKLLHAPGTLVEAPPVGGSTAAGVEKILVADDKKAVGSIEAVAGATPTAPGAVITATGEGASAGGSRSRFGNFISSKIDKNRKYSKQLENVDQQEKPRQWELSVQLKSIEYVGSDKKIDTFFSLAIKPDNPSIHRNHVRLLAAYTPAFVLAKNERKCLDIPIELYQRKVFELSYKELRKHVLKIDMWRVSNLSFNSYHGVGTKSLWDLARRDVNINFRIAKKFTKKETLEKQKKRLPISDVALFDCSINFEEMFDFRLECENWNLELNQANPEMKGKRRHEQKRLTFVMPKGLYSDASTSKYCHVALVPWSPKYDPKVNSQSVFFWPKVDRSFLMTGTRTSLSNQFFVVRVHSGNTIVQNQPPVGNIGKALMGLTSVLDLSVFKGHVKTLHPERESFDVGYLTGSVKCRMCSRGQTHEEEVVGGRPEQPKSASTVSHLNRNERHLVVSVKKCEGLAVADSDRGSSDPYLRIVWDNMVQKSPILKMTVRPVFNHTFYFPVRHFTKKCLEPRYKNSAMKYEFESKGQISIQVWDDDETSSDSLGFVLLPLREIFSSMVVEYRTLRGPLPKRKSDEENEFAPVEKKQWYDTARSVRIYDGDKSELIGCMIPNQTTALIHFEAYFYPDLPADLLLGVGDSTIDQEERWKEKERAWNKEQLDFVKSYAAPFPDSIGAKSHKENVYNSQENVRRFVCTGLHPQTLEVVPLMAFLVRIITPEEYSSPCMLLYWISLITFYTPAKQLRTGLIPLDGWKDPQFLLFRKMGPPQDHAVLLCSALLGGKKDAYVVKGTVWVSDLDDMQEKEEEDVTTDGAQKKEKPAKLVEHVWVMTREEQGWVTFWEPCTRELYHLPHRWKPKKRGRKNVAGGDGRSDVRSGKNDGEDEEEDALAMVERQEEYEWTDEVPDAMLTFEDLETLPTVGRQPRAKQKAQTDKGKGASAREQVEKRLAKQREKLPMAPKQAMLMEGQNGTYVEWLPYDSIDVVFNMDNLWANHQNHHPAVITYDFEDAAAWCPFVKPTDSRQEFAVTYLNTDVLVDPMLRQEVIQKLENSMTMEMEENMRLYRSKRGKDTFFDQREQLNGRIGKFLGIQEKLRKLDIDFCPIHKKSKESRTNAEKFIVETLKYGNANDIYNLYGTSHQCHSNYAKLQENSWEQIIAEVESFLAKDLDKFPTRKGKIFDGKPYRFSTPDREVIRSYLMQTKSYIDMLETSQEGVLFTVQCKMFGYLAGVSSTWVYVGVQQPQKKEEQ